MLEKLACESLILLFILLSYSTASRLKLFGVFSFLLHCQSWTRPPVGGGETLEEKLDGLHRHTTSAAVGLAAGFLRRRSQPFVHLWWRRCEEGRGGFRRFEAGGEASSGLAAGKPALLPLGSELHQSRGSWLNGSRLHVEASERKNKVQC